VNVSKHLGYLADSWDALRPLRRAVPVLLDMLRLGVLLPAVLVVLWSFAAVLLPALEPWLMAGGSLFVGYWLLSWSLIGVGYLLWGLFDIYALYRVNVELGGMVDNRVGELRRVDGDS